MNKFEDKGKFWYCDCYGPDCMKLSVEKNLDFGGYIIGIDPIVDNSESNISFSTIVMDIDEVVAHYKNR